tara:strand:+ start:381 stop:629 length:249 start_codon:yes stop_codon:yes gene_type:complete
MTTGICTLIFLAVIGFAVWYRRRSDPRKQIERMNTLDKEIEALREQGASYRVLNQKCEERDRIHEAYQRGAFKRAMRSELGP